MRVLVTDGDYRNTLAIVRSLGKKGVKIYVGAYSKYSCAFFSNYCYRSFVYPRDDEIKFVELIKKYALKNKIDTILPVGDLMYRRFSLFKKDFEDVGIRIPVVDYSFMSLAADKQKTLELAELLGIIIPSFKPNCFPMVVKATSGCGRLRFVNDEWELKESLEELKPAIVQEYIPGKLNYAFTGLFERGSLVVYFMHREMREFPVTGGSATIAESIYDEELFCRSKRLLEKMNWHGVAMVEYKLDDRDKKLKLMEVNPKFWASLDLAIASGVDFPWLLIKLMKGETVRQPKYRLGVKFRWFFEDTLNFFAEPKMEYFKDFFEGYEHDLRKNDLNPCIFQFLWMLGRISRNFGKFGFPYGRPL